MKRYAGAIWEPKSILNWQSCGYNIDIVCKADGLCGTTIIENKTTANFDYQGYCDSAQWRFYLLAFTGYESVEYEVFEFSKANIRKLNGLYRFSMRPYEGMEYEMRCLVDSLADVIKTYELEAYFDPDYSKRPNK